MEGLVEQVALVAPVHQHREQCPVEVIAAPDADDLNGAHRIDRLAGAKPPPGGAQPAHEMHDLGGTGAALAARVLAVRGQSSGEMRVGNECVSTCRYWWAPAQ